MWLFLMAGTFMAVVLVFPNGLAGLLDGRAKEMLPWLRKAVGRIGAPAPREQAVAVIGKADDNG